MRVEWSRLGGDACEGLLGVLLLRRHPTAHRVRPARGDGGVDVYVPEADGWVVYQIKSFTGALTSSQKRQIRESWESFRELVQERGLRVKQWYLLRPENPSWPDQDFLDDLTAGASWPCAWRGLDDCEELAAAFPDVIDYYLRDGRARLEQSLRDLLTAAGFGSRAGGSPVAPAAAVETLEALHRAVNAVDPHYRYDFSVDGRPPGVAHGEQWWPEVRLDPGLIAAAISRDEDRAVTFRVYARFAQATEERPVPGSFRVVAQPGTAEYDAWRAHLDYGLPTGPLPVSDVNLGLPGELGVAGGEGVVWVGPSPDGRRGPDSWTLAVLDEAGAVAAEVDLRGDPPAWGVSGRGTSLVLEDPRGAVTLRMRGELETGAATFSLTYHPVAGRAPTDLLPGLRVAAAFHAPNRFQLRVTGGPAVTEPQAIDTPVVDGFDQVVAVVELLAELQTHTFTRLVMPEPEQLTPRVLQSWEVAARLLRGERLHRRRVREVVPAPEEGTLGSVGDVGPLTVTRDLWVEVGPEVVHLGRAVEACDAARLDQLVEVGEGWVACDLSAQEGSRFTLRLEEATPQAPPARGPGA